MVSAGRAWALSYEGGTDGVRELRGGGCGGEAVDEVDIDGVDWAVLPLNLVGPMVLSETS